MKNGLLSRGSISALMFVCCAFLSFNASAQTNNGLIHRPWLLVVNQGSFTMNIIDPDAGKIIATVPTGNARGHGHEVAASPDGNTAYVPIYGDSGVGKPGRNGREIFVIDLRSRQTIEKIAFPHGVRPHCAVWDKRRHVLYVTTELDNDISIIDPRTRKVVGTVPTGQPESHMFALSHDGKRGYTANVGPGTVSVLDMEQRKTLAIVHISPTIQRISVSPDDSMVFTSDQEKPRLAVIDTATDKIKTWVKMPSTGYGTASTPDGRWLLVALPASNQVAVVDLHKLQVARTIPVCASPQEILVQPGSNAVAYVSCMKSNRVGVLNLLDWKMDMQLPAGNGPDGLAWASAR
jgi:YVTN family beta-propeller protein